MYQKIQMRGLVKAFASLNIEGGLYTTYIALKTKKFIIKAERTEANFRLGYLSKN